MTIGSAGSVQGCVGPGVREKGSTRVPFGWAVHGFSSAVRLVGSGLGESSRGLVRGWHGRAWAERGA